MLESFEESIGLNPFWFRAGGVKADLRSALRARCLNPFWFRAGGVDDSRLKDKQASVLIPFGSGLGGLELQPLATAMKS